MVLQYLLLIILIAFCVAFISVPLINKVGYKFSLVDKPDERKQHQESIVRVGGISLLLGVSLSILLAFSLQLFDSETSKSIMLILISSIFMFILGLIDDIFSLSFTKRLFFQIIFTSILWAYSFRFSEFDLTFLNFQISNLEVNNFVSYIISLIWVVGVINAFNWLDGLDGLAAGISLISSLGLGLASFSFQSSAPPFLIFALLGACLGFLIHNYNPAKIFMGDGGSYFIGTLIALYSLDLYNQSLLNSNTTNFNIFSILLILFVPLVDMTYVIFYRISNGKLPFFPDRQHLHHRLLRAGFSHKDSVIICYLISIFFTCVALAFIYPNFSIYIYSFTIIINFYFMILNRRKFIFILKKIYKL